MIWCELEWTFEPLDWGDAPCLDETQYFRVIISHIKIKKGRGIFNVWKYTIGGVLQIQTKNNLNTYEFLIYTNDKKLQVEVAFFYFTE